MSVDCRVIIGPTVEIQRNLSHKDFAKYHAFIEDHPELEDTYDRLHKPGDKLILFVDGMNGRYLRLTYVQQMKDGAHIDQSSTMNEMNVLIDRDIVRQMQNVYQSYTGEYLSEDQIKYSIWTMWY